MADIPPEHSGRPHRRCAAGQKRNRQGPAQKRDRPHQFAAETVRRADHQTADAAARRPDRRAQCRALDQQRAKTAAGTRSRAAAPPRLPPPRPPPNPVPHRRPKSRACRPRPPSARSTNFDHRRRGGRSVCRRHRGLDVPDPQGCDQLKLVLTALFLVP